MSTADRNCFRHNLQISVHRLVFRSYNCIPIDFNIINLMLHQLSSTYRIASLKEKLFMIILNLNLVFEQYLLPYSRYDLLALTTSLRYVIGLSADWLSFTNFLFCISCWLQNQTNWHALNPKLFGLALTLSRNP